MTKQASKQKGPLSPPPFSFKEESEFARAEFLHSSTRTRVPTLWVSYFFAIYPQDSLVFIKAGHFSRSLDTTQYPILRGLTYKTLKIIDR